MVIEAEDLNPSRNPSRMAEPVIGPGSARTAWLAPQDDGSEVSRPIQPKAIARLVRAPARGADQPGADHQCRRPVNEDRHCQLREAARGAGASAGTLRGKSCIRPQQASDG